MDQSVNPMGSSGESKVCKCTHHKMGPIMMIFIGLVLLIGALNYLTFQWVTILVAAALIIMGAVKLGGHSCKCCGNKQ